MALKDLAPQPLPMPRLPDPPKGEECGPAPLGKPSHPMPGDPLGRDRPKPPGSPQ